MHDVVCVFLFFFLIIVTVILVQISCTDRLLIFEIQCKPDTNEASSNFYRRVYRFPKVKNRNSRNDLKYGVYINFPTQYVNL